ncbi:hypothetical protein ASPSYDRAFT_1178408 [Aspergillus sydowii CBS 593.65]|uniref:Uncharacterized protein n=1 Tax=Aspergillus sydowii CBS 593.65 TaxID=1036612 RepID=A0A1L9TET0_9EURO|nr:uncharacterized protein ASPSYDRAFT_1178408 [Aspergillus sydowii CBS 593.65]OJJ57932.1 hypothetical protein ASPSYDRAFT_1178408 [Aspergillus sydowii CBS 593.65]
MKLPAIPLLLATTIVTATQDHLQNANHIFNAIHASMRQFGSSLHHNGMSFFLASVPQGIQLYHGSPSPDLLKEVGWMAFEPEHAMVFAQPARGRRSRGIKTSPDQSEQVPLAASEQTAENRSGYLHSYRTAKDLRLLYIDGTSAGKSRVGTLDSQDRILFNDTISPGGVGMEEVRARTVCHIAKNTWQGRIDGVIRMAAGFEIILCDPEVNLVPVRVMPVKDGKGKPRQKPAELMRAVMSRFNGIGGERVRLIYDHFVTAYTHPLDLFPLEDNKGPRLQHLSTESLEPLRDNLTDLVMEHDVNAGTVNWQAIADLVADKYAPLLRGLIGKDKPRHHQKKKINPSVAITTIMAPFDGPDIDESVLLCASQFVSTPDGDSPLAHQAVYTVSHRICSTLLELRDETDKEVVHSAIRELMVYLDWTAWKECRGCKDTEFCAVPVWPQGSQEDHDTPKCQRFTKAYQAGGDYWGPVWD